MTYAGASCWKGVRAPARTVDALARELQLVALQRTVKVLHDVRMRELLREARGVGAALA